MGYIQQTLDTIKLFKKKNWSDIKIIELGSQDIYTNIDNVFDLITLFGNQPLDIKNYINKGDTRLSTKYIYDSLQVKEYKCIDIDGAHDSLKFDLNYNIRNKYGFCNQYDIVTNFGTTEHILNQFTCFKNIHNLCKVNGYIIIGLPIEGSTDHSFFNYHSTFFEHLAQSNNYEIHYVKYNTISYYKKNDSRNITVIYKKINNNEFILPIQNKMNIPLQEKNSFESNFIRDRVLKMYDIDLFSINNFAIFGTGQSGKKAYTFAKELNLNIICFIDDYKTGYYENTNIPIISYKTFLEEYQSKIELIIIGSGQKGNLKQRVDLEVDVLELLGLLY